MTGILEAAWLQLAGALNLIAALIASGHVVLRERDNRVAAGWVAVIWLAPVAGWILYLMLGVNRIRRRAEELRREGLGAYPTSGLRDPGTTEADAAGVTGPLAALSRIVGARTRIPLTSGNQVDPLRDGEQAYPAMLEAIERAGASIALCTYIFDNDPAGEVFIDALGKAAKRGVQVRVLVDSMGARYSWPRPQVVRVLRRRGVEVARFMHSAVPWRMPYINLRTHRKILVVDGHIGFTGGMNIRSGHLLELGGRHQVQDTHFRLRGPIVEQMMQVFADDWAFTTGERLEDDLWFPGVEPRGSIRARGIPDGPDEDIGNLPWTLLGALSTAQRSIRIVTPYFLPDADLITTLNLAAMRGVNVEIVLPLRNNLRVVKWAMDAQLWQVLRGGCRVHLSSPPFDHSKIMTVDGAWSLIGSANWDPRSLRLNFEYSVECYGEELANQLDVIIDEKMATARPLTRDELEARSLPVRLRDGVARLLTPYL